MVIYSIDYFIMSEFRHFWKWKKICTKFVFFRGDFAQDPLAHRGFENPLRQGTGPSGIFKSPLGFGDLGQNPLEKIRILSINYFGKSDVHYAYKILYKLIFIQILLEKATYTTLSKFVEVNFYSNSFGKRDVHYAY